MTHPDYDSFTILRNGPFENGMVGFVANRLSLTSVSFDDGIEKPLVWEPYIIPLPHEASDLLHEFVAEFQFVCPQKSYDTFNNIRINNYEGELEVNFSGLRLKSSQLQFSGSKDALRNLWDMCDNLKNIHGSPSTFDQGY